MVTLAQAIAIYSYIDRTNIDLGIVYSSDLDFALLTQVNSLLASAAERFSARQYNDAITGYHAAESLIYAHLDPHWTPDLGSRFRPLCPGILLCSVPCRQPHRSGSTFYRRHRQQVPFGRPSRSTNRRSRPFPRCTAPALPRSAQIWFCLILCGSLAAMNLPNL